MAASGVCDAYSGVSKLLPGRFLERRSAGQRHLETLISPDGLGARPAAHVLVDRSVALGGLIDTRWRARRAEIARASFPNGFGRSPGHPQGCSNVSHSTEAALAGLPPCACAAGALLRGGAPVQRSWNGDFAGWVTHSLAGRSRLRDCEGRPFRTAGAVRLNIFWMFGRGHLAEVVHGGRLRTFDLGFTAYVFVMCCRLGRLIGTLWRRVERRSRGHTPFLNGYPFAWAFYWGCSDVSQ